MFPLGLENSPIYKCCMGLGLTAEEVHVPCERMDCDLMTRPGKRSAGRSIPCPSIMRRREDVKVVIECRYFVFKLFASIVNPQMCKERIPPNRKSSFLSVLAVRVALLLTPGGSVQTSSVTFSNASC